jgi:cephalosporin-C deacetylase-like acetyl esterase
MTVAAPRPPDDLREFWSGTLAEARGAAAEPKAEPVETDLRLVRTWDVTFSGYGGDAIRAWYHLPADTSDSAPVVVHYQGYGGGRRLAPGAVVDDGRVCLPRGRHPRAGLRAHGRRHPDRPGPGRRIRAT